jgi:hypothetical protein
MLSFIKNTFLIIITLFIWLFVFENCVKADDAMTLQELTLSTTRFFPGGVDPLVTENGLPNRQLGWHFDVNVNTTLLTYLYLDSRLHADTDSIITENEDSINGQFRAAGLEFHFGINFTENLQLGYYHHSQHVLDTISNVGPFPRADGVELRYNLYKSREPRRGIF